jgi:hypothetical protein
MENIKTAMVAAVSEALKFKERNPKASDEDVIGHVVKMSGAIISKID